MTEAWRYRVSGFSVLASFTLKAFRTAAPHGSSEELTETGL